MITEERREYLLWSWENETNDLEIEEWREGLTAEEQKLVDAWDDGYCLGIARMCERMEAQKK